MRQTAINRKTALKATKRINPVSRKTLERNGRWRVICIERAKYLILKYGFIICEYSGERIANLTTVADDMNDGWGHHIDGNRNHCVESNCYITKYKYHTVITDNNIKVTQEDFQGRENNSELR